MNFYPCPFARPNPPWPSPPSPSLLLPAPLLPCLPFPARGTSTPCLPSPLTLLPPPPSVSLPAACLSSCPALFSSSSSFSSQPSTNVLQDSDASAWTPQPATTWMLLPAVGSPDMWLPTRGRSCWFPMTRSSLQGQRTPLLRFATGASSSTRAAATPSGRSSGKRGRLSGLQSLRSSRQRLRTSRALLTGLVPRPPRPPRCSPSPREGGLAILRPLSRFCTVRPHRHTKWACLLGTSQQP